MDGSHKRGSGYGEEPYPPLQQRCQTGKWEDSSQIFSRWAPTNTAALVETPILVPQPFLRGQTDDPMWWTGEVWAIEKARFSPGDLGPSRPDAVVNNGWRTSRLKLLVSTQDVGPGKIEGGHVSELDIGHGVRFSSYTRVMAVRILAPEAKVFPITEGSNDPAQVLEGPGLFLDTIVSGAIFPGCCGPVSRGVAKSTLIVRVPPATANAVMRLPVGADRIQIYMQRLDGSVPTDMEFIATPPFEFDSYGPAPVAPIPIAAQSPLGLIEFIAGQRRTEIIDVPGGAGAINLGGGDVVAHTFILTAEIDL